MAAAVANNPGANPVIDPILNPMTDPMTDTDEEVEPETEALEVAMEDLQTAYTAIVGHLDTCAKGLHTYRQQTHEKEVELATLFERAERSAEFGAALLAELEKLDATGRAKDGGTVVSNTQSNGHTESLPTGRP